MDESVSLGSGATRPFYLEYYHTRDELIWVDRVAADVIGGERSSHTEWNGRVAPERRGSYTSG